MKRRWGSQSSVPKVAMRASVISFSPQVMALKALRKHLQSPSHGSESHLREGDALPLEGAELAESPRLLLGLPLYPREALGIRIHTEAKLVFLVILGFRSESCAASGDLDPDSQPPGSGQRWKEN